MSQLVYAKSRRDWLTRTTRPPELGNSEARRPLSSIGSPYRSRPSIKGQKRTFCTHSNMLSYWVSERGGSRECQRHSPGFATWTALVSARPSEPRVPIPMSMHAAVKHTGRSMRRICNTFAPASVNAALQVRARGVVTVYAQICTILPLPSSGARQAQLRRCHSVKGVISESMTHLTSQLDSELARGFYRGYDHSGALTGCYEGLHVPPWTHRSLEVALLRTRSNATHMITLGSGCIRTFMLVSAQRLVGRHRVVIVAS